MMSNTETQEHSRYTTQDKIVDGLMVVCVTAAIYGLLLAAGF
jgi:hypothetical protein